MASEPRPRGLLWSRTARVLRGVGLSLTFVAASAVGVALHADLPVGRRLAAQFGELALSNVFEGKIVIGPLAHLGLTHFMLHEVRLFDTQGRQIVLLTDVHTDVSLVDLLHEAIVAGGNLAVVIDHVRVERSEVELVDDPGTNEPSIVRALTPKKRASTTPSTPNTGTGPSVLLRDAELGRVIVHIRLPNEPPVEARLRHVEGKLDASAKGVAIDVGRFGLTLRGAGQGARGTGTFTMRLPGAMTGTFHGFLGDVEVAARAVFDGHHLEAVANVPRATEAALIRVFPDWPVHETIAAQAEVSGDLPDLHAHARVQAGPATLDADGPVIANAYPSANLVVTGRHLDARAFLPGAPATDVSLDATVAGRLANGKVTADITARTGATVIGGQPVPAVIANAKWEKEALDGKFEMHEPGLPITGSFHVSAAGVADVDARVEQGDIGRVLRPEVRGLAGKGRGRIRAHVEKGTLRVSADADVSSVVVAGATLERAHVTAQASGPLNAPKRITGTVHVQGSNLVVQGITSESVVVDAHGSPDALHFDTHVGDGPGAELHLSGNASLAGVGTLHDVDVSFHRDPVTIAGHVVALDLNASNIDIERISVNGAGGTVTGSARLKHDLLELDAAGENVDLSAIGRALGLRRGMLEGTLRVDASLATGRDVTRGRVRLGLRNGTIGPVGGASLQLSADLNGRSLKGNASGLVAGLGTFGATWDGALGGRPLEVTSWKTATGSAEVQVGDVKLGLLGALLPKSTPVDHLGGRAYARVLLGRTTDKSPLPDVSMTVATRELTFEVPSLGKKSRVEGIDLTAAGTLDGATGDVTAATRAADNEGDLFAISGSIRTEIEGLIHSPRATLAKLWDTPFDMVVSVPRRNLATLPALVRPEGLIGEVSANVRVRGTPAHPIVAGGADAFQLGTEGGRRPTDIHADAQYDVTTHAMMARMTASLEGRPVADGAFSGALPTGLASWVGSGRIDLNGMPIDLLGPVAKSRTNGQLSGDLTWSRTGSTGAIGADVRITDFQVNQEPLGTGELHVDTAGDLARATLHFAGVEGTLDANGSAPISFQTALPTIGRDAPVRAHLTAHDFSAVALAPLVTGVLTRLDGRLDADVGVEFEPSTADASWNGGVQGTASIKDGSVLIDALGLEVRDLSASAEAHGSGAETNLSIRDVRGRVRSTKDNLHASAELVLEGPKLVRGTATLKADDLPVSFQGAPQGRITGETSATLTRDGDRMLVDVQIPSLVAQLPQASTRQVIALGDNKDVSVVQLDANKIPTGEITPWRLSLHLGNNVSLKRSDVELFVSGSPVIDLDDTAEMSGTIDIASGGRVPVLGKVFIVEHGRVIFDTGDTANPRLDVSTAWRAPDDTMVYVDVTGTLRELNLAVRSDPPLPEPEVYALLLGGSSQDSTSASDTSTENGAAGAGAVALGGGMAALGVNQLIANNPVEVRVDSTSQSLPRYTAAVRIRPNLWFEASEYQQTDYSAGGASDRSVFSGTVDYRFTNRWSLRTEVGTAGGALDLLWQYRY